MRLIKRYTYSELGFAGLRVCFNDPFVLLHNFLNYFEAKPAAFAHGLGRKKGVEYEVDNIFAYTWAVIDYAYY